MLLFEKVLFSFMIVCIYDSSRRFIFLSGFCQNIGIKDNTKEITLQKYSFYFLAT